MINNGREWDWMDSYEVQTVDRKIGLSLIGWDMDLNDAEGGRFSLPSTKSSRANLTLT
jgi:hypothetical protein